MYIVEVVGDKRHINDKTPEDEIEFDSGLGFTQERWMQKTWLIVNSRLYSSLYLAFVISFCATVEIVVVTTRACVHPLSVFYNSLLKYDKKPKLNL